MNSIRALANSDSRKALEAIGFPLSGLSGLDAAERDPHFRMKIDALPPVQRAQYELNKQKSAAVFARHCTPIFLALLADELINEFVPAEQRDAARQFVAERINLARHGANS